VAADGKIHLTYWESFNSEELPVFEDLARRFEAEYAEAHPDSPPVLIEGQAVPWDNVDQLLGSAAQAGKTPDLVRIDYNKIISVAFGQVAVPLEEIDNFGELFPGETIDSLRSRFVPAAYDKCVMWRLDKRHLYALPEQVTCLALMWNRALFRARRDAIAEKAENENLDISHDRPPETWEEFEALGRALTWDDEGVRRYGFGMREGVWWQLATMGVYHAELIHQDPETGELSCTLASDPRAEAALTRIAGFHLGNEKGRGFEGGAWNPGADWTDRGFEIGTYAMVFEGSWTLRRFTEAGLDFAVAPIPRLSDVEAESLGIAPEENTTATNLGGAGVCVVRTALERGVAEQALEFIAWWTSAEVQAEWGRRLGQIPVNLEAQRMIRDEVDERTATFIDQSLHAKPTPPVPRFGPMSVDIVDPNLVRVFSGDIEPIDALRRIERDINEKILSLINID
jgi:ABC-type glycerol-3-phosphate transport system substrate-binding protein